MLVQDPGRYCKVKMKGSEKEVKRKRKGSERSEKKVFCYRADNITTRSCLKGMLLFISVKTTSPFFTGEAPCIFWVHVADTNGFNQCHCHINEVAVDEDAGSERHALRNT